MIEIKNLHKSFGHVEVLKGVDVSIEEKEVVVIIGPSGSGKSTLLRCMNYLEEPTSGTVIVDNMDLSDKDKLNTVRTEVGMVFQRFNIILVISFGLAFIALSIISSSVFSERSSYVEPSGLTNNVFIFAVSSQYLPIFSISSLQGT